MEHVPSSEIICFPPWLLLLFFLSSGISRRRAHCDCTIIKRCFFDARRKLRKSLITFVMLNPSDLFPSNHLPALAINYFKHNERLSNVHLLSIMIFFGELRDAGRFREDVESSIMSRSLRLLLKAHRRGINGQTDLFTCCFPGFCYF